MLTDDFIAGVAVDALGSRVPGNNPAIGIQ